MTPAEQQDLRRLEQDFEKLGTRLQALVLGVLREGVTGYPVFIASLQAVGLGVQVAGNDAYGTYWNYRLSPLEELVKKGLVSQEQLPEFKNRYRDPRTEACVLVVPNNVYNAQVAFVPYPGGNPAAN